MLVDNTGQSVQQDHHFTWNLLLSPHMKSAPLSASAAKKHSSWGASDPSSSLLHEIICVMMRERELITRQPSKGKNNDSETPRSQFTRQVVSPAAAAEEEEVGDCHLVIICLLNADALDQRGCKTWTALYLPCTHTRLHSHTHSPLYQKIVKTFVWRFKCVVQILRWLVGPYLAAVYLKSITLCNTNIILTKGWFKTR